MPTGAKVVVLVLQDGFTLPMPFSPPRISDPYLGTPKQKISLRLAYVISGLTFTEFLHMFTSLAADGEFYLYAYQYGSVPKHRPVANVGYTKMLETFSCDASEPEPDDVIEPQSKWDGESQQLALLPRDQYVWSTELADAVRTYLFREYGGAEADARGTKLQWTHSLFEIVRLLEEEPFQSKREAGKIWTRERNERLCEALAKLKEERPGLSELEMARQIAKGSIAIQANGKKLSVEMVRKLLRDNCK